MTRSTRIGRILRRVLPLTLVALAVRAGPAEAGEPCAAKGVRVLVVPFAQPAGDASTDSARLTTIGHNVGALLTLQVWLRLRGGAGLGSAVAGWEPRIRYPVTSHAQAARVARQSARPAQLVLWGLVSDFGDWLVIQPRLTVVPDTQLFDDGRLCTRERTEIWKPAHLPPGWSGPSLDLPRHAYAFEPISVSSALAARFAAPAGLTVYRKHRGGRLSEPLGPLGDEFRALKQARGALLVRAEAGVGWIDTTGLAGSGVALDLLDGVIRIMRGDFARAEEPLVRVARSGESPLASRVDALLLRALARAHRRRRRADLLDAAARIDPQSVEVARARIAEPLGAWLSKVRPRVPDPELPAGIEAVMAASRYLFAPDDRLWGELGRAAPR